MIKDQLGEHYHHDLNLVFPKDDGSTQKILTVRAKFNRLIDKANVRQITFHDLRKMHAYLLLKAGVSLEVITNRLGYKKIEPTLEKLLMVMHKN